MTSASMLRNKTSGHRGSSDNGKSEEREGRNVVRYKCVPLNTIKDVMHQRPNWIEVKDDGEWDFNWCDVGWLRENFDHAYMEEHVRINHFRNHYELTRKNLMVKNLKRFQKNLEKDMGRTEASKCDFFPSTFAMPSEYHLFVEEFNRNPGSTWIMKPVAKSQGKGIFLFRKLKDIIDWKKDRSRSEEQKDAAHLDSYVVQRYIENPYLINGRKFDLRVYVLVTSYVPLKVWLYRDGFARFSSSRFSLSTIDDKYMHLTNVSVQKTAPDYDPEKGCKWQMQQLRRYLTAKYGREVVETLFGEMDNIIIRSLQSVQKVIINDKHCFELYGYDILLDHDLKPWLIEVNASPSHTPSSQEDYEMKYGLLEDTLNVVDMEGRLTGQEKRVGGFDLMWNDGPVYTEDLNLQTFGSLCFTANTHLGEPCIHSSSMDRGWYIGHERIIPSKLDPPMSSQPGVSRPCITIKVTEMLQADKPNTAKKPVLIRPPSPRTSLPKEKDCQHFLSCEPTPKPIIRQRSRSLPSPSEKKRRKRRNAGVRFVDSLGLDLEDVRLFKSGEDPFVPHHVTFRLLMGAEMADGRHLEISLPYLKPVFAQQPGDQPDFLYRLYQQKVCLEKIQCFELGIVGITQVVNLHFEKDVRVRYSFTEWKGYTETKASWVSTITKTLEKQQFSCDAFRFHLPVPPFLQPGSVLEFAIKYKVCGTEHWDNNNGENYKLVCHNYKLTVPKECEESILHFI